LVRSEEEKVWSLEFGVRSEEFGFESLELGVENKRHKKAHCLENWQSAFCLFGQHSQRMNSPGISG